MPNAFRILSQSPVYFLLDGKTPAAGGRIEFYEAGTTTAKDVYTDEALSDNNGSSVELGSDGRPVDDIWGDGSYRMRVYAADGTLISDDDNVEIPGGSGTAIPALVSGEFLTNDGSVLQWAAIREVLDPTGASGKVLGSDGTSLAWVTPAAAPTVPTLTSASNSQKIGDTLIQWGSGTAPASGGHTTSQSVTFATAYSAAPFVTVNHAGQLTSSGFDGVSQASGITATGFNAAFDINVQSSDSAFNITSDVDFTWLAVGTTA